MEERRAWGNDGDLSAAGGDGLLLTPILGSALDGDPEPLLSRDQAPAVL